MIQVVPYLALIHNNITNINNITLTIKAQKVKIKTIKNLQGVLFCGREVSNFLYDVIKLSIYDVFMFIMHLYALF